MKRVMATLETSTEASRHWAAPKPNKLLGIRHFQVTLLFFGVFISCGLAVILSVTIVAMVNNEDINPDFPQYNWNQQTQAAILSGYTWGLIILQIPGGLFADKFDPVTVTAGSIFVPSLFAILTPVASSLGWGFVFACRFGQGLGQGMLFPAVQVHMARWIPVQERGVLTTLPFTGGQLGFVLAQALSGVMSTGGGGWPSVFYLFGGLGVAWTMLWMLLGSNSPAEDRFISIEERAYIEDSLRTNDRGTKPLKTPWRAMLTSWPVWAIIVSNCGWAWGFWTLVTEVPTFVKTGLKFDLATVGLLSALPYLLKLILAIIFSATSECINSRRIIQLSSSRKLFNSIGNWIPAVALIGLAYTRNATLANVFLNVAVGVNAACYVSLNTNMVDIAPNFASTIFAISNVIGTLLSCFAPLVVGFIVTDTGSVAQWQIVFYITAGVYFFTGLFFVLFGTSDIQWWNDPNVNETTPLLSTK